MSAAAVASTLATAEANGVVDQVDAVRTDGLEGVEPGSLDLVVCNPPFHRGTALDRSTTPHLFARAAVALRPGGELWTVWNSHLPYLPMLRARVGSTSVVTADPAVHGHAVARPVLAEGRSLAGARQGEQLTWD